MGDFAGKKGVWVVYMYDGGSILVDSIHDGPVQAIFQVHMGESIAFVPFAMTVQQGVEWFNEHKVEKREKTK